MVSSGIFLAYPKLSLPLSSSNRQLVRKNVSHFFFNKEQVYSFPSIRQVKGFFLTFSFSCELISRTRLLSYIPAIIITIMRPLHRKRHSQIDYHPQTNRRTKINHTVSNWMTSPKNITKLDDPSTRHQQPRLRTQPSQRPQLCIFTQTFRQNDGSQKSVFQAKSVSLLNTLSQMMKPKRQSSRKRRRTATAIDFKNIQLPIEEQKKNKRIPTWDGFQNVIQEMKESKFKQFKLSKKKVVTKQGENYNIDEQIIKQTELSKDFNKKLAHVYSRSRKRVFETELSLKTEKKENKTSNPMPLFNKMYYSKYMKHYMERKKFLQQKDWIKKATAK